MPTQRTFFISKVMTDSVSSYLWGGAAWKTAVDAKLPDNCQLSGAKSRNYGLGGIAIGLALDWAAGMHLLLFTASFTSLLHAGHTITSKIYSSPPSIKFFCNSIMGATCNVNWWFRAILQIKNNCWFSSLFQLGLLDLLSATFKIGGIMKWNIYNSSPAKNLKQLCHQRDSHHKFHRRLRQQCNHRDRLDRVWANRSSFIQTSQNCQM